MKELKLCLLCLFVYCNCSASDSISLPNHNIGISLNTGFTNNDIQLVDFKWNDFSEYQFGYDIQIGIYYEKRLSKRLLLSNELGLRYSDFTSDFGTCDNNPINPIYDITCHDYQSEWKALFVAASVNLKFYYYKKKRLYFETGAGLDFRLTDAPDLKYQTSTIHYADRTLGIGEGFVQDGKDREDQFEISMFVKNKYARFNFGLGFEVKQFDIALFYKSNLARTVGVRLRHSLFKII